MCIRKEAQNLRERRKQKIADEVEELELRVNQEDKNVWKVLKELRATLNKMASREMEEHSLFFHEWWAEKSDRPISVMFWMLKVKHIVDYIPLMKDGQGNHMCTEEENKRIIILHF